MAMDMAARAMAKGAEQKAVKQGSTKLAATDKRIFSLPNAADGSLSVEGVKGKTVQDVSNGGFSNLTGWGGQSFTRFPNGFAKVLANSQSTIYLTKIGYPLKPSTKYTFVIEVKSNNLSVPLRSSGARMKPLEMVPTGQTGTFKVVIESVGDFSASPFDFAFGISAGTGEIEFRFMILEGDWTNKEIPPYFEGIKSVGEDTGKLSVKSTGKNLFSNPELPGSNNQANIELISSNELIVQSNQVPDGAARVSFGRIRIPPLPQGTYTFSLKRDVLIGTNADLFPNVNVYYEQSNGSSELIGILNANMLTLKLTITKEHSNLLLFFYSQGQATTTKKEGKVRFYDIQIEKDAIFNPIFEPSKWPSKIEIPLTEPLRSLPNGVSDEIKDGKIIRRVVKVILNGTEPWGWSNTADLANTAIFSTGNFKNLKAPLENRILANIINSGFPVKDASTLWTNDVEGIDVNQLGGMHIRIAKSRLSKVDLDGFKAWLSANPVQFYYELATPTEEPITIPAINSFTNGMVTVENNIWPNELTVSYSTNVVARVLIAESTLSGVLASTLTLADKELAMKSITTLAAGATLTDAVNKVNQILGIWR